MESMRGELKGDRTSNNTAKTPDSIDIHPIHFEGVLATKSKERERGRKSFTLKIYQFEIELYVLCAVLE